MSSLSDTRKTILEIFNEVRRKTGINTITSFDQDANSRVMMQYFNDVIDEVSDFGDWQEMLSVVLVTAQASVSAYVVSAVPPVKSIREVAFTGQIAPLRLRTIEDLRRWSRTGGQGVPSNYTIMGVDNTTTGNPIINVYPVPATAQAGTTFNILYYQKPVLYNTSTTTNTVPSWPSRMLSAGLLAKMYEDETAREQDYAIARAEFEQMRLECFNRYNGDTGKDTQFVPSRMRQRSG